jgi:hypothetical protein
VAQHYAAFILPCLKRLDNGRFTELRQYAPMDFVSTSASTSTRIAIGVAASIRVLVRHFAFCVVLLSRASRSADDRPTHG